MRRITESVFVDQNGKKYVKIRSAGYELYGTITQDGFWNFCGGHVGPSAGWKEIDEKDLSKEDKEFKRAVEKAPERPWL